MLQDFLQALGEQRPTVDAASLRLHEAWQAEHGTRAGALAERLYEMWRERLHEGRR